MTINVTIHDVEHGSCATIKTPNGKLIMIDAGHSSNEPWFPSTEYEGETIEIFICSNFDEDHLSDFVDLEQKCNIRNYRMNWTIGQNALLELKGRVSEMGSGVKAIYELIPTLQNVETLDLGGVQVNSFKNQYLNHFSDTNNLSLVSFVSYKNSKIVFPGDLEKEGWEKLLLHQDFQNELQSVNVFVASHHGRDNGICPEVFNYCSPEVVIISDSAIQHDTQDNSGWYSQQVRGNGINFHGQNRKVLTTRNDGHISLYCS